MRHLSIHQYVDLESTHSFEICKAALGLLGPSVGSNLIRRTLQARQQLPRRQRPQQHLHAWNWWMLGALINLEQTSNRRKKSWTTDKLMGSMRGSHSPEHSELAFDLLVTEWTSYCCKREATALAAKLSNHDQECSPFCRVEQHNKSIQISFILGYPRYLILNSNFMNSCLESANQRLQSKFAVWNVFNAFDSNNLTCPKVSMSGFVRSWRTWPILSLRPACAFRRKISMDVDMWRCGTLWALGHQWWPAPLPLRSQVSQGLWKILRDTPMSEGRAFVAQARDTTQLC